MSGEVVCAECQRVVPQENTIQCGDVIVCAACKPLFVQRLREGAVSRFGEVLFGGFWLRCLATLIDAILLEIIVLPILVSTYGWRYYYNDDYGFFAGWVDVLASWILPTVAILAFWNYRQATPGKMLFGLKIIDARTGTRPSIGQFIVRYLMYIVCVLPLGLGLIWVAFDKRKQGWHDKVARTAVIRANRRQS